MFRYFKLTDFEVYLNIFLDLEKTIPINF